MPKKKVRNLAEDIHILNSFKETKHIVYEVSKKYKKLCTRFQKSKQIVDEVLNCRRGFKGTKEIVDKVSKELYRNHTNCRRGFEH